MHRKGDVAWLSSITVNARIPSPRSGSLLELRDALFDALRPYCFRAEGPDGDGIVRMTLGAYDEVKGPVDAERMIDQAARVIHRFTGRAD
jgi:hypothetical protein